MDESNKQLRERAERCLQDGCCFMMAAFNIADAAETGYTFDAAVRERAAKLVRELMYMHFDSDIMPHPRAVPEFQRFMAGATRKPARRGKRAA